MTTPLSSLHNTSTMEGELSSLGNFAEIVHRSAESEYFSALLSALQEGAAQQGIGFHTDARMRSREVSLDDADWLPVASHVEHVRLRWLCPDVTGSELVDRADGNMRDGYAPCLVRSLLRGLAQAGVFPIR